MRALVTGATGFVGTQLMQHLRESGDEAYGIDRERDVTDEDSMREIFETFRPDVTYHLAALTHVGESWKHAEEFTRVNVVGTRRVLDAAYGVAHDSTTIVVSSSEVYGVVSEGDQPLREDFRVAPANPYSSSKVEAEHVAHAMWHDRRQRVVIVRPFNHVGPGQSPTFAVPALASRLLDARARGATEIPVGDLSTRRDFSDVRDVVRAYRLLAEFGASNEVYNVASGHDVALSDIAERLVEQIAPDVKLVVDPELLRPNDIPVFRGSFDKLNKATGWSPRITLDESLRDVVADLTARRSRSE
ncbi:MAG TPA: GDP-mannose 4,6-dehydratase [Acidimicrobiales bacterium]|jgi:GDP-4-dehydro-6-deoxy-D-mannose reductase|nr:GDP-mannose 4,6-dehydratase [Acidimicrobiales bacterium]